MITNENRVKNALTYLAQTDVEHARAKARVKGLEQKRKTVFSVAFLESEGSGEQRRAKAYVSNDFVKVTKEIESAELELQTLTNKRLLQQLVVDVWRSENANRRQGNV